MIKKGHSKTTIARMLAVSRTTLQRYLSLPGAPRPDRGGRYALAPVRRWLELRAPRAGEDETTRRLKTERLELQCVAAERALENLERSYVRRAAIAPTLESLIGEVKRSLEKWFLRELPPTWTGLAAIELQQKNIIGVDAVIREFREGKLTDSEEEETGSGTPVPQPSEKINDPLRTPGP